MKKQLRLTQQGIVFAIFVVLFGVFSIFLRGFLSTSNMLNLLQNVAVLGTRPRHDRRDRPWH